MFWNDTSYTFTSFVQRSGNNRFVGFSSVLRASLMAFCQKSEKSFGITVDGCSCSGENAAPQAPL